MQNLIGISVADSAEQTRIGERPLERVILGSQSHRESIEAGIKGFEPAGVQGFKPRVAHDDVQ